MKLQADSEWYIAAAGCRCHACASVYISLCVKLIMSPVAAIALVPMPAAAAVAMPTGTSCTLAVCSGTSALC